MTTLLQLARATGLAVTTVSEILRDKPGYQEATRQRVRAAAQRLQYRPSAAARQLRGARSGVLGVLVGLDDPQVNLDRLAALERAAFEQSFRLLVGQVREGDDKMARYLDDFAARGIDGLIWLHQPFRRTPRVDPALFTRLGAVVALDQSISEAGCCVRVDYAEGIRLAVRHLFSRGRRRIALALAGAGRPGDPLRARQLGYRTALKEVGLTLDKRLTWLGQMEESPSPATIDAAVEALVKGGRANALLASNDIWAAALIRALRRRGLRIPEDVAVVGFDNLNFSALLDPALTTVDQAHPAFAAAALDLMNHLLARRPQARAARTRTIAPALVVRESA